MARNGAAGSVMNVESWLQVDLLSALLKTCYGAQHSSVSVFATLQMKRVVGSGALKIYGDLCNCSQSGEILRTQRNKFSWNVFGHFYDLFVRFVLVQYHDVKCFELVNFTL